MSDQSRDAAVEWVRRQLAWESFIERAAEEAEATPEPRSGHAERAARPVRCRGAHRTLRSEPAG